MKKKKHAYLYRITAIIMLVLFLPTILFFVFFWQRSYKEMERANQIYYEKMLDSFTDGFMVSLTDLKLHASKISANSKDTKSAFCKGSENFMENEYWYYEAVNEMDQYSDHNASAFGVYYYEMDCVITGAGTQTAEQYIRNYLGVKNQEPLIRNFFKKEDFKEGKILFATTNTPENSAGDLLVGYCTKMGKKQDNVLIFYLLEPDDYKDTLSVVYSNSGIKFFVMDETSKQIMLALGEAAYDDIKFSELESERKIGGRTHKNLYQKSIEYLPISLAMYITEDSYQGNVVSSYYEMRNILWATVLVLFVICVVVLYIVYRPIYKLMTDLDYNEGDEFEAIRNTLNDKNAKIQEQEMLILDLLLRHMVSGRPISEKKINQLGITAAYRYYCVFVLEGHILLTGEIERITEEIENKFSVRLFVTDWQGENKNLLIVFMQNQDTTAMETWIRQWFDTHFAEKCSFYAGNVVDKLNDVRSSLLSCLEKKERTAGENISDKKTICDEVKTLNPKEEQQKKMKEEILNYLEVHFRDEDLCQTQVADAFRISSYTLSRMFKNQVGVGFTEYVNSKRIEYAKELLLTTSYSVREIAVMVGFINDNYFSRIFKTIVGVSPTVFREK